MCMSAIGRCLARCRRASVLPHRRARDGRRRPRRAAGRAAVRDRAGLPGQAARHQQRGAAPARLFRRRHSADPSRVQDALPRDLVARGSARARSRRRGRGAGAARPFAQFLAVPGRGIVREPAASHRHGRPAAATPSPWGSSPARRRATRWRRRLSTRSRARVPGVRFVGIAGPKMEAAGCEDVVPLEKLSRARVRRSGGASAGVFGIRRELRPRLLAERVPVFRRRGRAGFQPRPRAQAEARGVRTVHFVSPSVWAWRRERLDTIGRSVDRMLALFPFEPAALRGSRHPGDLRRASDGAGRRDARDAARDARAAEARLGDSPCSRCCPAAACPRSTCTPSSCWTPRRAVRGARRRALPRAVRDARHARRVRDRDAPERPGAPADHAALRPRGGRAARRRRRHRRVGDRDARGGARALPARSPSTRVDAHRVPRAAQVPAACTSDCPTCWPGEFVVPEFLQENANARNLAQAALNLFDDTVTRRRLEALFADSAVAAQGGYRRARRSGRRGGTGLRGSSHADRRHRRGGPRAAGRARVRRGGDPRSARSPSAACAIRRC